jgi:signal transduction histidine kinase
MADARLAPGPRLALLAVAAAALTWAIAAIVALDPAADRVTTYAAALPAALVTDLTAGLSLIVVGGLALSRSHTRRLGLIATMAGLAWFGPDLVGWDQGPPLLRSLGTAAAPFLLALTLHLALAAPAGRLVSPSARAATAAAYAIAAVVSVGGALFRDPLLDLYCWRNCSDNSFLVHAHPGIASALDDISVWSTLAIGLGLLALTARRLLVATGAARKALLPVLAPLSLVGASEAAYAVALLRTPLEDPERADFAAIFITRSVAFATLALGLAWSVLQAARSRARVTRLATELGEAPPPGKLREALRAAVGDPAIDVVYPRTGAPSLVDANGRPTELPTHARGVARITRGGRTLALVLHDPAFVDEFELELALGPAARLAVENEALRAEALAQLHELRASRARVVAAGDAARRGLERNLHDGAQQRLLALSYDLRLARAAAQAESDSALVALLEAAGDVTATALVDLRDLAHGIYPAILTEAGVATALATLADNAPLPVMLADMELVRQPPEVETTAYVTVAEAIDDAASRGATFVAVRVCQDDAHVVVSVDDDGTPRTGSLIHVADRVGALGGSLEVNTSTLRAEIPCA